jgi:Na+-transporting NADH:ubiquinone oxidoreductase subunit NqrF
MGHAEGGIKYLVALKTGEKVPVGGPFKLYFSLEGGYWEIVYMILPGFKY